MKSKILLLLLTLSTVLLGCKKDKAPQDRLGDAKKEIIGMWQVQSSVEAHFDASGKQISSEDHGTDNDLKLQFIDQTTFKSTSSDLIYRYTLADVNGKIIMTTDGNSYEVKLSNNTMIWISEGVPDDNSYAKYVSTVQFKKL